MVNQMYVSGLETKRPSIKAEREMLEKYMPIGKTSNYVCENCNSCGSGDCNSCCSTPDD